MFTFLKSRGINLLRGPEVGDGRVDDDRRRSSTGTGQRRAVGPSQVSRPPRGRPPSPSPSPTYHALNPHCPPSPPPTYDTLITDRSASPAPTITALTTTAMSLNLPAKSGML